MLRETCSILALHCLYIDSRLGCVLPGEENLPQIASRRLSLDKHVLPTLLLHHHHPLVQRLHLATQPSSSHTTWSWSLHFGLLPLFRDVLFLLLTYRSGYPNPPIWPKYGVGQFGKYVCGLLALLAPTALVGGGGKWKFPGGKTSTRARGGAAQLADRFFGGRGCWVVGGGTEEYSAPALSRPLRALPGVGSDDPPTNPILSPPMWITAVHPMSCKIPLIRFTCHLQELTIAFLE